MDSLTHKTVSCPVKHRKKEWTHGTTTTRTRSRSAPPPQEASADIQRGLLGSWPLCIIAHSCEIQGMARAPAYQSINPRFPLRCSFAPFPRLSGPCGAVLVSPPPPGSRLPAFGPEFWISVPPITQCSYGLVALMCSGGGVARAPKVSDLNRCLC